MVELFLGSGCKETSSVTIEKDLVIPQIMMSSNDRYCRVVQLTYELVVEAFVPGCHGNVEMTFPITIGSVPFIVQQPSAPHQNNFAIASAPMSDGHKNNFVAPPPMPELRKLSWRTFNIQYLIIRAFNFSSSTIIQ